MTSQIEKAPNNLWKEKEATMSTPNVSTLKSIKRLKSPKKSQDCKKSAQDVKIENVFLNSEYFKHQSGNISSLSFCSGDNGENQWTIDSKFGIPFQQKPTKRVFNQSNTIKSDTAVLETSKVSKHWQQKLKNPNCLANETQDKTDRFLEGILTGKGRLDRDLITLITEQMFLAERELQVTRTHLIETISKLNERDLEILQLHEKIQNLQATKKTDSTRKTDKQTEMSTKSSEDYQRLILASEKLKKQVKDMEEFLDDYGLVWVGDKVTNEKPDFDKIVKSFQRLNAVASEPKIIQTVMGAKFEIPHEYPVTLYSNGLLLRNTDFREYANISASSFLKDVEDGYFPSELQPEFPEGVPFEVVDKRNEVYNKSSKIPAFQGLGNRLGSTNEGKPSSMVFLQPLKNKNHDSHTSLGQESSERALLKKLHKKRPRNTFSQEERSQTSVHLDATCQRHIAEKSDREIADFGGPQLNLKIRFGREKTNSFFLQIPESNKMFSFQFALQKKLCEMYHQECIVTSDMNNKSTDFEIHVYGKNPFRLSDRLNASPAECGIVNNCVINITEI